MKYFVCFVVLPFFIGSLKASIIINEFCPAPKSPEPEWIELFNPDSIAFISTHFEIADSKTSKSLDYFFIKSNAFSIITTDSLKFKESIKIPDSIPIFQLNFPALNNDSDEVKIKHNGVLIDSLKYIYSCSQNSSLERIRYDLVDDKTITCSKDSSHNSAGRINSVSKYLFDAKLDYIIYDGSNLSIQISNCGIKDLNNIDFKVYIDINKNNDFEIIECIKSDYISVNSHDSLVYIINKDDINKKFNLKGYYNIKSVISSSKDANNSNNEIICKQFLGLDYNDIVINEIMFDIDDENSEYIELYNKLDDSISLHAWRIWDANGSFNKKYFEIEENLYILPHNFFIIAWDSSLINKFQYLKDSLSIYIKKSSLNLNSSTDALVISNKENLIIDSIYYSSKWHDPTVLNTKNISLERINPSTTTNDPKSWSSSADNLGGTPLKQNSISIISEINEKLKAEPNPFSPSKSKCLISYVLPFDRARLSIKLFDRNGAYLSTLLNNDYSGKLGSIVWEADDDGFKYQPGAYIINLEAVSSENQDVFNTNLLILIGD